MGVPAGGAQEPPGPSSCPSPLPPPTRPLLQATAPSCMGRGFLSHSPTPCGASERRSVCGISFCKPERSPGHQLISISAATPPSGAARSLQLWAEPALGTRGDVGMSRPGARWVPGKAGPLGPQQLPRGWF